MNTIQHITWGRLLISQGILLFPVLLFMYYKTPLIKSTLIAAGRMIIQLFLVGIYLEYLFKWNNPWINLLWGILIVIIAGSTIIQRTKLPYRHYFIPLIIAIFISLLLIDIFFFSFTLHLDNLLTARYFIPITGMLLGNSLKNIVIAMQHFYTEMRRNSLPYQFALATGASFSEALRPYLNKTFVFAFNPIIATMSIIGLIALPGMMTGQILGGSNPNEAIKYQIMLMLAIFVSNVLAVFISIRMSNLFVFDKYGNLKEGASPKTT